MNSLLAPYSKLEIPTELTEEIDKHKEHVQRDISQQVSIERECFFSEVFPVLVQILVSSPDILFAGAELVQNLKYHYYDDTDLNTILAAGKELKKAEKETYLRNKFHYGDILIRNRKGSATEYLLCISPPCDVCRPGKVKLNICFINGLEVPEAELTVKRKENVHISVLPINNGCKTDLKYVAWRLFDIVKFDLGKKEDYESICSYSRPFMMSEQYLSAAVWLISTADNTSKPAAINPVDKPPHPEKSSIAEGIDTPPFQMSLTIHFIITLRQETVKFRDAKHFISV